MSNTLEEALETKTNVYSLSTGEAYNILDRNLLFYVGLARGKATDEGAYLDQLEQLDAVYKNTPEKLLIDFRKRKDT